MSYCSEMTVINLVCLKRSDVITCCNLANRLALTVKILVTNRLAILH